MRRILIAACSLAIAGLAASAHAQSTNRGFELNRYEPTTAGEWSFWVDHPWYSSMRYFAGGITLNYAHNPLVLGNLSPNGDYSVVSPIIEHRLMGHVDLAGSFLDRVLISASLPIMFLERGSSADGVTPIDGVAVGDPRVGVRVRLFGQPYRGPISMSLGADVWIPIHFNRDVTDLSQAQVGDTGVRVLPKLMLGGLSHSVMWSLTAGFLYRGVQSLGSIPPNNGNTVGSEVQLGASIKYANLEKRFAIGPEAVLSTVVIGQDAQTFFRQNFTSLELLLGIHYNIARVLQLGVGGGVGLLREPGTPDGRVLFRLAYAPMKPEKPADGDHDGIADKQDACPLDPGVTTNDPATNGCPDSDGDGVVDLRDQCPQVAAGPTPDPQKPGCPYIKKDGDEDGDGILDSQDQCRTEPAGNNPDPAKLGCPLRDKDGDGVFDDKDQCLEVPAGPHPDPNRPGCPDKDSDNDGIYDGQDQCKDVPSGLNPDPAKPGCPLPDRDNDQVPDGVDSCPDQPGAHSPDPKKNGCPGLVEVKGSQIIIKEQVFFATNKDIILKKSFPVLDALAHTLKSIALIKKVLVEGHTDNKGKDELNINLSDRRAKSVMRYLIEHGIAAERLEAKGFGPTRPIADNKTNKGRALNRRVDFKILDPVQTEAQTSLTTKVVTTPPVVTPVAPGKKAAPKGKGGAKPKGAAPAAGPGGAPVDDKAGAPADAKASAPADAKAGAPADAQPKAGAAGKGKAKPAGKHKAKAGADNPNAAALTNKETAK